MGNAAGIGAKLALLSGPRRDQARDFHRRVHYIELATYPRFSYMFAKNCNLKPFAALE